MAAVSALAALGLVAGCADDPTIRATGNVADERDTISVPLIAHSSAAPSGAGAGAGAGGAGASAQAGDTTAIPGAGSAAGSMAAGATPFLRVSSVEVTVGESVTAGQVLLRLDDTGLAAHTARARADAAVAAAQPRVLDSRISETRDKEAELRDKRAEVTDTIATLRRTRADVTDSLATLRANRGKAADGLAQAKAAQQKMRRNPAVIPPSTPGRPQQPGSRQQPGNRERPGTPQRPGGQQPPSPQQVQRQIAELESGIARMDAGIAKATAGLARIDEGLARARDGLVQIDDGIRAVQDARRTLQGLRRVAVIAAEMSQVTVEVAELTESLAVITAPAPGSVVEVVAAGTALPSGAPVATLRPASSTRAPVVTTWLAPEVAATVCTGTEAGVGGDWTDTQALGRVTYIAPTAEYPPTEQATEEVHLLRAVRVDVTVQSGSAELPPGAPADVSISPCPDSTDGPDTTDNTDATDGPDDTDATDPDASDLTAPAPPNTTPATPGGSTRTPPIISTDPNARSLE